MGSAAFQRVSDLGVLEYCKSVKTALIVVDIELLCIFETKLVGVLYMMMLKPLSDIYIFFFYMSFQSSLISL